MKAPWLVVALAFVVTACDTGTTTSPATSDEATTSSTSRSSTTAVVVEPATSLPAGSDDMALYRADPVTLRALPGTQSLTTGDWMTGHSSPNGDWLALHVWRDTDPETDLIQVIETSTGEIVTEVPGRLADFVGLGDDGSVYQMRHLQFQGSQLRRLVPHDTGYETVFEDFPSEFVHRGSFTLFDSDHAAWFGTFGGDFEESVPGFVVADLSTGSATTHLIDGLTFADVGETEFGDWTVYESVTPFVLWDPPRLRALIVHGDEDAVTVVDLVTGEYETHEWSEPATWKDHVLAWLIPPARAKGPSHYGVTRTAALDPERGRLYVGTSVSNVEANGEEWSIESAPRGVVVIDTETWEIIDRLEVPVSEVTLSPDGGHLVATGAIWSESLTTSDVLASQVHVFETDDHELVGLFDAPEPWAHIQFSPNGDYMYIGARWGDAAYVIVNLNSMAQLGRAHGTLFAESMLFTVRR